MPETQCLTNGIARLSAAKLVKNGSGGFDIYKLDKRGNKKAVEFIKNLDRDADIYVQVVGSLKGDTIKVTEIKDAL